MHRADESRLPAGGHRTTTDPDEKGWPKGIPYIIGNEACERFSFYGMKAILYTYLVYLYTMLLREEGPGALGGVAPEDLGTATIHFFIAGVYAFPMIGAIIADRLLGKYRTILYLSMVYCAGHAALSIFENNIPGTYFGLALIAVGSGGIKPCVSAHVGDQFGKSNWKLIPKIYQIFYFSINFGSFFSTLLIPLFKEWWGWSVAFAIPGVLMAIATFFFWLGRNRFVHVPPKPGGVLGFLDALAGSFLFMIAGSLFFTGGAPWWVKLIVSIGCLVAGLVVFTIRQQMKADDGFLAVLLYSLWAKIKKPDAGKDRPAAEDTYQPAPGVGDLRGHWFFGPAARRFGQEQAEGPLAVFKIISVFLMISVFWGLFDQHSSSWLRQAAMMDRVFETPWGNVTILVEQTSAVNPILVMLLIPCVMFGLYPLMEKLGFTPTPLRRMTIGMIFAACSFVAVALVQDDIFVQYSNLQAGAHKVAGPKDIVHVVTEVHVSWQLIAYGLITLGEVLISVTGLEFAYTQAPRRMKSQIMGFWLLTVALGNVLVAVIALGGLDLTTFFWLFAGLCAAAALIFGLRAAFYRYQDYPQG
jgi:POT family proton-dependent oligopeptide transporter